MSCKTEGFICVIVLFNVEVNGSVQHNFVVKLLFSCFVECTKMLRLAFGHKLNILTGLSVKKGLNVFRVLNIVSQDLTISVEEVYWKGVL